MMVTVRAVEKAENAPIPHLDDVHIYVYLQLTIYIWASWRIAVCKYVQVSVMSTWFSEAIHAF